MHLGTHLPLRDSLRRRLSNATKLPVSTSLSNSAFANISAQDFQDHAQDSQDHDVVTTADLSTNISIVPRVVSTLPPFAYAHFHGMYSLECRTRPIFSLSSLARVYGYTSLHLSPLSMPKSMQTFPLRMMLSPPFSPHTFLAVVFMALTASSVYLASSPLMRWAHLSQSQRQRPLSSFRDDTPQMPFVFPSYRQRFHAATHTREESEGYDIARTYGAYFSFPFYRHCRNALLYARKR